MGACCTKDYMYGRGYTTCDKDERDSNGGDDGEEVRQGEDGATVRIRGSSAFSSMFTQRGRKGINQDAMTVWEDFSGEKDLVFCGVFDGHGPSGHKVARHARELLPSKLSKAIKKQPSRLKNGVSEASVEPDNNGGNQQNPFVSRWEAAFEESFKEFDQDLGFDSSIDCFCSGTTAVTIIKQGEHLVIANVGDSRAVLLASPCQDPWEIFASRITASSQPLKSPTESSPEKTNSSFTKLQIWDVLTNKQVINIVASARNRSMAAKLVVKLAVREWKRRFPGGSTDDCAVICLFFKNPPMLTKSMTSVGRRNVRSHSELAVSRSCRFAMMERKRGEEEGGSVNRDSKEDWKPVQGLNRANSQTRIPRFTRALSHNHKTAKLFHEVEAR